LDTAGALSPIKGAGTTFKPLLWSSKDAEVVSRRSVAGTFDPSGLLTGFKPTGKHYVFAASVTGKVKTAFPDGPPKGVKLPPGTNVLKASVKPLHLIVFADSDMLADFLWVHHLNLFGQPLGPGMGGQRRRGAERARQHGRER
ncbi:auxiliary component of ABC transporter, partial [mine drainage metagenome]